MKRPDPLQALLKMTVVERIDAVANDVHSGKNRYRRIDARQLADALGVPQSDSPGDVWGFTRYAEKERLEEYAQCHDAVSELVCQLEGKVSPERYLQLVPMFSDLDDVDGPGFGFLTGEERRFLEDAVAMERLEANASNGMNCIAHYTLVSTLGQELTFEAAVEDDGTCIDLKTPYHYRDGKVIDLDDCVTESW